MRLRKNRAGKAGKITPDLVAAAVMEMQESTVGAFNIYNEAFGVHATAINAQEARVVELEKAVASLLAEGVD